MSQSTGTLAAAHIILHVQDIDRSLPFYRALGLAEGDRGDDIAVIELRGGTHLLLIERGGSFDGMYENSRFGQRSDETFDLMIQGKSHAELEVFREQVIEAGIAADEIPEQRLYGHSYFTVCDPDGYRFSIYNSHKFD